MCEQSTWDDYRLDGMAAVGPTTRGYDKDAAFRSLAASGHDAGVLCNMRQSVGVVRLEDQALADLGTPT